MGDSSTSADGPPPIPQIKSIDFSVFHALDHVIGSRYCWTQHGGPRVHYRYWREFKGWGYLACKYLGRHDYTTWTRNDTGVSYEACRHCHKREVVV